VSFAAFAKASGRSKRPDVLARMHFEPGHIYHLYNRGNNKVPIFFSSKNYLYLLAKVRTEWLSFCDVFSYCLMPNHFHFMLQANNDGCQPVTLKAKSTHLQNLSKAIGKSLSSYTQAVNIQNNTTGNLFQKKTKAKCLTDPLLSVRFTTGDYLRNCFFYIHNNPLAANLVADLKDWPYSSWLDYYGFRNGSLCNQKKAIQFLDIGDRDLKAPCTNNQMVI